MGGREGEGWTGKDRGEWGKGEGREEGEIGYKRGRDGEGER